MSLNTSPQDPDLEIAKKNLSDLSYSQPDVLIQHSLSLLQTFSNFKLQLSIVEKNSVQYQLAQVSGPGFTSLQREGTPSFLVHLWLDRDYPLQSPDVTLTDLTIPDQYFQPFYNPDTFKIEYSVFYEWNKDSTLIELLLAITKVLAHTSLAWLLQITQQAQIQTPQEHPPQMNTLHQPNIEYPSLPSYSNGPAPYYPAVRYPNTQRFLSQYVEPVYHPQAKNNRSSDCTTKAKGSRRQNRKQNRKFRHTDKNSDSEITNFVEDQAPSVDKIQSNAGQSQSTLKTTEVKTESCEVETTSQRLSSLDVVNKQTSKKDILCKKLDPPMREYITPAEAEEGIRTGIYFKGPFYINQRNYEHGYVYSPMDERDVLILGVTNRNRAMPSDIVVVEAFEDSYYIPQNPESDASYFNDLSQQRMGRVVAISQKKHSRKTVGFLKYFDTKQGVVLFSPRESRLPRILIPLAECPADYVEDKRKYDSSMFAVQIIDWKVDSPYANGNLMDCLGDASNLEIQIKALLIENDITHDNEFTQESLDCLPLKEWNIPKEEYETRRDLTGECIFTIDPSTARDMDDALHCKKLDADTFEVGVHIADVSYFVKENSALDLESRKRGTSVYLTHKVIRMLPEQLADKLCSLNPSVDRLALSVVFKMNSTNCEPFDIWYGRTIIRSCYKMHYELAGEIIQSPIGDFKGELEKNISGQPVDKMVESLLNLNLLATKLRELRIKNGSLILQKIKLAFSIDPETGHPIAYSPYIRHTSHFLIEEFMLLANKLIAQKLAQHYPEHAIVRLHHPPSQHQLDNKLFKICADYNIPIDISSAGGIMQALHTFSQDHDSDEICILSNLCAIPMTLAKYTRLKEGVDPLHYALNFKLYTHYTSPIRRYPDLLVHRQLAAAIDQGPALAIEDVEYDVIPEECNESKVSAKKASMQSNMLFFAYFLHSTGPIEENGRIMKVLDCSFDVMLTRIGIEVRVYCERIIIEGYAISFEFSKDTRPHKLKILWKTDGDPFNEELKLFTPVRVIVSCLQKEFKLDAIALPPIHCLK